MLSILQCTWTLRNNKWVYPFIQDLRVSKLIILNYIYLFPISYDLNIWFPFRRLPAHLTNHNTVTYGIPWFTTTNQSIHLKILCIRLEVIFSITVLQVHCIKKWIYKLKNIVNMVRKMNYVVTYEFKESHSSLLSRHIPKELFHLVFIPGRFC